MLRIQGNVVTLPDGRMINAVYKPIEVYAEAFGKYVFRISKDSNYDVQIESNNVYVVETTIGFSMLVDDDKV